MRDDDGVSSFHIDGLMLACCDTGQCGQRLALAARRDKHNLLLRVTGDHVEIDEQTVRHFEITDSLAMDMTFTMLLPESATFLPYFSAQLIICCTR